MKLSLIAPFALFALGCSSTVGNQGQAGTAGHPNLPGTVFTIVFENEAASDVITPANPTFYALSLEYGRALHYGTTVHPSLPNYIEMTSGSTWGITDDNDPNEQLRVMGTDNIAAQLDAGSIMWRAYMEGMGAPCTMTGAGKYAPRHDPFVYYDYLASNPQRCANHVVDFDQTFADDLASGLYRYMWITPNVCNDMHDCDSSVADTWLAKVVPQIQASDAYKKGGVIFILFDEGSSRAPGAYANLPVIVVSPGLVKTPLTSTTSFDHTSYLASVEDILGLPRLPATANVTSMDELF
jgi:hypothetical protein